jgi:hypothetical protein
MRRTFTAAGLLLAAFSVTACQGSSSSSSSSKSAMACGHWGNIRGDIRSGILSDSEIRSKVSEVRDSATTPAVESAATTLLAGITSGSKTGITSGYTALNAACG